MNVKVLFLILPILFFAQEKGHYDESPYKQLKQELATPNMFRTASGAPGPNYYQQQADYKMQIRLDEDQNRIFGDETITYTNNSPDKLDYLWVQLDQNRRAENSPTREIYPDKMPLHPMTIEQFTKKYRLPNFPGGFHVDLVQDNKGNDLKVLVNMTMMRIDLPKPLQPGEKTSFRIKWWYNINNYLDGGGRSGYEHFDKDGNNVYVIAQFFPRMAVYNDVEGWQNMQFWGRSEFALPFGDYDVEITVPADHILNGTGKLQNPKEVLTKEEYNRFQKAWKTYDNPVVIVTENEARVKETKKSKDTKTWKFKAENVRDFGFSTSRKFIWDAFAVKLGGKDVLAMSLYPKEGNPLWGEYSTRVVAHTLKEYSKMTFDYPYHKAISVHAKDQGMEYPMICWNYGRPNEDGTYSDRIKYGMISVIIHEIGHNFFPMIVNSDERQWTWMDEGLNTFLQYLAEQNFDDSFPNEFKNGDKYPSRRGNPKDIEDYMSMSQNTLAPIMTQGDHVYNFGANAYGKPATGLVILRNTVMGPELFDYAFKTYAQRWMFKHPTPADFFRTMEDASAVDLDWFWRGWFYTTWYTDIGIKEVKPFYLHNEGNVIQFSDQKEENHEVLYQNFEALKTYDASLSKDQKMGLKNPKYFYEVTFEKPGKLIMPLLLTFEFKDGTEKEIRIPYMVWRINTEELTKVFYFDKEVEKITVDKNQETADINRNNNVWKSK